MISARSNQPGSEEGKIPNESLTPAAGDNRERTAAAVESKPLAVALLEHWRAVVFGTLAFALAGALVGLCLPKGYRSGCLILVTPPKAAENLKLAPEPLHMTTVHSLANSDYVLDRTLDLLRDQHLVVRRIVDEAGASESGGDADVWRGFSNLSPAQAAEMLGEEPDSDFEALWEDLPPAYLLPAALQIDLADLQSLDPILVKKRLSSRIRTTLENMHQVEYQPVLELEAEWDSPGAAALAAHAWAKTLIRTLREQYLDPTLDLQAVFRERFAAVNESIDRLNERIESIREESGLRSRIREKESAMKALYGTVERIADLEILPSSREQSRTEPIFSLTESVSEGVADIRSSLAESNSLLARRADLARAMEAPDASPSSTVENREHRAEFEEQIARWNGVLEEAHRTVFLTQSSLAALEVDREVEERKRAYLIGKGAFEAANTNYEEMWGVRLMAPPSPPRTHASPTLWKIVLLSGIGGFVMHSLLVLMSLTLLRVPPERWDEG